MSYLTKIEFGDWNENDIILFPVKDGGPSYDLVCEVIDGKLFELPYRHDRMSPNKDWECFRIDYKFISDGTWYIEGTEAYPLCEPGEWGCVFFGWTNETFEGYLGKLPRWDGESCSMSEFKIYPRITKITE